MARIGGRGASRRASKRARGALSRGLPRVPVAGTRKRQKRSEEERREGLRAQKGKSLYPGKVKT